MCQVYMWTGRYNRAMESRSKNRFRLIGWTIIKSKRDKIFILINLAIPSVRNVPQEEAEKKLKYKDKHWNSGGGKYKMLCHAGSHWSHKNCKWGTKNIFGSNTRKTFNTLYTLGSSHVTRKALQSWSLSGGGSPPAKHEKCHDKPLR
jgi:hypothetical protein